MEIDKSSIHSLNPDQKRAVLAPDHPILIVAGAGTGKTRTLTSRIAILIERGLSPDKICALTFTNKAAKEMVERIEAVFRSKQVVDSPEGLALLKKIRMAPPFIGTFHSLGARILRENARKVARNPNFVIFDGDDAFKLIKKIIKENAAVKSAVKPADIYAKISAVKNGMIGQEELKEDLSPRGRFFSKVLEKYEARLVENNAFDFDDLILKPVELFKTNPETLERYQRRYSHFLVDEYQDINNVQYALVSLLARKTANLSVVGDHNQTIYSWRGSNLGVFLGFERDWPKSQTYFLGENYRSTSNILEAASAIIKDSRKPEGLKTDRLWTKSTPGRKVRIVEFPHEMAEAEWIAQEIRQGQESIDSVDKTNAILYRTNAQSRALEQALIENNIPYQIFGGLKFYERREIKDVLAALRLISNPADELSRERLDKALRKGRARETMAALQRERDQSPVKLISAFLAAADYFDYIDENLTNPADRKENIAELIVFASGFKTLEDFLERASLLQATDEVVDEKRKKPVVSLMTIHLAKGLEFDNVFIAGASEGVLPHHRSFENAEQLEEERRLMYVAMTRARSELCLSFFDLPSRFLSDIPPEITEFAGERSFDDEERYITLD